MSVASFLPVRGSPLPPQPYLDLLKQVLTDSVFAAEPDEGRASPAGFIKDFVDHYIRGRALTMLPRARLDNIEACIRHILARRIPGDLIETGVWRGGSAIFMRGVLAAHAVGDRIVWAADSFAGLPAPDAARFPREAKAHDGAMMRRVYRHFAVPLDEVRGNFARLGLLDEQVRFLPGWFKDTLPEAPIRRLALLRIDADYYESTYDALQYLYDRLSTGGFVIVDDYGEESWTHCREAVEDFRRERGIADPLQAVDGRCWFWRKSA